MVNRGQGNRAGARLRQLAADSHADRTFFADAIAEGCKMRDIEKWVQQAPNDAAAWCAHAAKHIAAAWDARGGGRAGGVSQRGWRSFERHLASARDAAMAATERQPDDPGPFYLLLKIAVGAEGPDTGREYFQAAVSRDPTYYPAYQLMMTMLLEKWHGSHRDAYEFAAEAAGRAPEGSDLPVLLIQAHIEHWMYFELFEDNAAGGRAYLRKPDVQDSVKRAWRKSLGAPSYRPDRHTPFRRNEAAMWFYLTEEPTRLKKELTALGGVETELPWQWKGRSAFRKAHKLAKVRL